MGILQTLGLKKPPPPKKKRRPRPPGAAPTGNATSDAPTAIQPAVTSTSPSGAGITPSSPSTPSKDKPKPARTPAEAKALAKARAKQKQQAKKGRSPGGPPPGKGKAKGASKGKAVKPTGTGKIMGAAAQLHERRRRLVAAREATLRDLGGLMLEMYKRNRFREALLLDKCEEVLAIEVEIAHVDQRLFQIAPANAAGIRPIGRCECGATILPGQNFCGVCGRSFHTLSQTRACDTCGTGLRPGDVFCASCGNEAPDMLDMIDPARPPGARSPSARTDAPPQLLPPPAVSAPASRSDVPPPPSVDEDGSTEIIDLPTVGPDDAPDTSTPGAVPADPPSTAEPVIVDVSESSVFGATPTPAKAPGAADASATTPSSAELDTPSLDDATDRKTPATEKPAEDPRTAERQKDRDSARRRAQLQKAKAKVAKQRAKERAKAARRSRKRGDS